MSALILTPLRRALAALACLTTLGAPAHAGMGYTELPGAPGREPVTVFYPTQAEDRTLTIGPFAAAVAPDATPQAGKHRLIVISHGSGGNAWVYSDLARALVQAGYLVALPLHDGDNYRDFSKIGAASWVLRPQEVSAAIDVLAASPRFAPLFDARRVGVWGMSAGGHTALTLAGGQWSRARQRSHCLAHLEADFSACTGGFTQLDGNWLDGLKLAVARTLIGWRLPDDPQPQGHADARIRAVVAGVPYALDFDPASLARPVVPLGLIRAGQDIWLRPQTHIDPVLAACQTCTLLADLPDAGHGALLSPLPPGVPASIARLISDPPGFERAALPALYQRIAAFFDQHLLP